MRWSDTATAPWIEPGIGSALLLVQHAEIEREQGNHDGEEGEPHPQRLAEPDIFQEFHVSDPI